MESKLQFSKCLAAFRRQANGPLDLPTLPSRVAETMPGDAELRGTLLEGGLFRETHW